MINLQIEGPLDDVGMQILEALQRDARISFSELGRQIGMSPPAVAERVRRMEDAGIITGYHAQVNLAKVGFPITAFVRVNAGRHCSQLGSILKSVPEVMEYHRVTGDDSGIIKLVVSSVAHLEVVIDQLASYGTTTTSIVLSNPITERIITREMMCHEDKATVLEVQAG
ncbi:MAG: Lrp/AsnC family transcriptional regulator [Chloroflexota bacterium]|nr:Lrp/AsnC family transcriptional regulator [Chloroflexota bacterium]